MADIKTLSNTIILDNAYATITVANEGAAVVSVIDKKTGNDIKGEDTAFFALVMPDKETEFATVSAVLEGDVIKVKTEGGNFDVKVTAYDSYFEFETLTALPDTCHRARVAHAKYSYDPKDKANTGACGIALTYWMNPCYYPDSKNCETKGEVHSKLNNVNGKYALIIAPICEQRDIIKTAARTIDRNCGIYSETGGA